MTIDQRPLPLAGNTQTAAAPAGLSMRGWAQGLRNRPAFKGKVPNRLFTPDICLDLLERAVVLAVFAYFVYRMVSPLMTLVLADIAYPELLISAAASNIGAVLLVASEILGVALILSRRRSATVSSSPLDWALTFAAVNAPYLAILAPAAIGLPSQIGTVLMLTGMVIQIWAKAAMWRSFGIVPANHGVKVNGPYRFIRHPMYAGYTMTHIGFILGFPSLQNTLLYATAFAIQVARLLREERILNRDPSYRQYAERVRYRLLPLVF